MKAARKTISTYHDDDQPEVRLPRAALVRPAPAPPPAPALALAVLVAHRDGAWFGRLGDGEVRLSVDASVDPALLDECLARGARVVVEPGPTPTIVGALSTARAVTISREGDVDLRVKRFAVAAEDLLLKTAGAFVQVKLDEVEIYGRRIAARAREMTRILGRMIKLN